MAVSNTTTVTGAGFANAANGAGAATVSGSSATSAATLASNFDQFLTLLTTQLRNQSPLDPLDTNQFTQQLVQFAGVEQQLKTNDTLASLLTLNKATATTNAVGFIGSTITADGAAAQLKGGVAEWRINAARGGTAAITIRDATGNVVQTATATLAAGAQSYRWNGTTSTGATAPAGAYSITVDARDVSGQPFTATTEITGAVDGVDLTGDTPLLKIGAISVALDKVKSIVRPQTAAAQ